MTSIRSPTYRAASKLSGAIFANRLRDWLVGRPGEQAAERFTGGGGSAGIDPATLPGLDPSLREPLLGGLADSIAGVFGWAILFTVTVTVAVPVLAWFIREIPLRDEVDSGRASGQTTDESPEPDLLSAPGH